MRALKASPHEVRSSSQSKETFPPDFGVAGLVHKFSSQLTVVAWLLLICLKS